MSLIGSPGTHEALSILYFLSGMQNLKNTCFTVG